MNFFKNPFVLSLFFTGIFMTVLFAAVQSEGGAYCRFNMASVNPVPSSSSSSNEVQQTTPRAYPDAPDFTLTDMDGEAFTLSDHKGKVIVLNIWATWCPPCRKEIPDFMEMQDEMRDDGVLFVGVSFDETGWDVVRPFAEEYQINYPLVVDDGTINASYGPITALPTTFIINKEGQVEHVAPGMILKAQLEPILQELAAREKQDLL